MDLKFELLKFLFQLHDFVPKLNYIILIMIHLYYQVQNLYLLNSMIYKNKIFIIVFAYNFSDSIFESLQIRFIFSDIIRI